MAVWGLTNSRERREAKGKGEKKRYTHLNAEFQRIARRDKKAFLSKQYKEVKENNRMGKTRDLFVKIRDIKGTFHTWQVRLQQYVNHELLDVQAGFRKGRRTRDQITHNAGS